MQLLTFIGSLRIMFIAIVFLLALPLFLFRISPTFFETAPSHLSPPYISAEARQLKGQFQCSPLQLLIFHFVFYDCILAKGLAIFS